MADDSLSDAIEQNAQGPKQVVVDGTQATQHSLREQIEADEYLAAKRAARKSKLPIRLGKIKPDGTL